MWSADRSQWAAHQLCGCLGLGIFSHPLLFLFPQIPPDNAIFIPSSILNYQCSTTDAFRVFVTSLDSLVEDFLAFFKQVGRLDQVSPSSRFLPEEWEVCRGGRAETLRSERTKGQKRRELLLKMEQKTLPGATRKSLLTGWNLVSLNDLATVLSVTHISTLRGNLKLCPAEVRKYD